MSSRDRREPLDALEVLIRQSLHERVPATAAPRPEVRRRLMNRASRQTRRLGWRLPVVLNRSLEDLASRSYTSPQTHILYAEALFGPRLSWLNQLMR
jgi:hypothetical protein